jgi:hypothetical protein
VSDLNRTSRLQSSGSPVSRAVARADAIPPIVVASREQLASLAVRGPAVPIVLDLQDLDPVRAQELSARLTRLRSECGCAAGAKAMWAAALVALAALAATYGWSTALIVRLPLVLVAAAIGAVSGKVAGIALSRRAYSTEVRHLLAAESSGEV